MLVKFMRRGERKHFAFGVSFAGWEVKASFIEYYDEAVLGAVKLFTTQDNLLIIQSFTR